MSTIFSKIIDREIPATIIYEDDEVLAFLDISPVHPGHTLVIPKKPSADARATSPEDLAKLMSVVQKVAQAQTKALGCAVNIIFNCGEEAGQEVFHTHAHVIPRYAGDGAFTTKKAESTPEQNQSAGAKIKAAL
jgi:histidine triad (HIT) family protein